MERTKFRGLQARREEALARQGARNKRSPVEQLAHLDEMFGPGLGAVRERKRLAAAIEDAEHAAIRRKRAKGKKSKKKPSSTNKS
tara:strand:+ start:2212 stop:2466 length:255 start_codon:yes stop_codon:yes gene_type:complete